MADRDLLFDRFSLSDTLYQLPGQIRERIGRESRDYILNVNEDEYRSHIDSEYRIEPLQLDRNRIEIAEQAEKSVVAQEYGRRFERKGTFITFAVPFSGEREFFFQQPSTLSGLLPRANVTKNSELLITLEGGGDPDKLRAELNGILDNIDQHIHWQRDQLDKWNDGLSALITNEFKARKDKLLKDAGVLGSLGFPLRKRANIPATFSVPVKKKIAIERPQAESKPYEAHPTITEETYQDILAVLKGMTLTMERSPSAFEKIGEEDLRMYFLMTLNGSFEADATGETFNFDGKTDILLRKDGRNVFIAECKFWGGPKLFSDTVDQLLNYLTWRDSHTAIILFVRDTSIATVLRKIPETIKAHPNFLNSGQAQGDNETRVRMKSNRDSSLSLDLTIQVYHVPKTDDSEQDAGGKGD